MAKELVIASNRHETKLAVLEDDQLVEVFFQRSNEYSLAGSIHKGRVTRVLPGMQSAFVDLGLDRDCFLYVSDFFEENEEYDKLAEDRGPRPDRVERPERVERVERVERLEPVPPPPAERLPLPVAAVAETSPAPAERPAERPEDAQDRDRRGGRRSRRRRNRGRGFPDSKYATESAPQAEAPAVVEATISEEFPVLPGESLAKYRRLETGFSLGAPATETEEPPEFQEPDSELEPEPGVDAAPPGQPEQPAVADEAQQPPPPAPVEQTDPPWDEPETEPSAGEPSAEAVTAEDEFAEDLTAEDPTAEDATDEGVSEEEFEGEPGPVDETTVEPAPAGEVERARIPQSLTATLREQGGRYMHRVSRRMRRKTRGGPFGEGGERREGERRDIEPPRADAAPRPEMRTALRPDRPPLPSISELLKEGQEILVQVAKEPLGQKGARITSHIALPGRYCVYMPTVEHMGVSRKIASDDERQRLRRILQSHRAGIPGGFIVRTAGEGHSEEEIAQDMTYLSNLWPTCAKKRRSAARRPCSTTIWRSSSARCATS